MFVLFDVTLRKFVSSVSLDCAEWYCGFTLDFQEMLEFNEFSAKSFINMFSDDYTLIAVPADFVEVYTKGD